jgi:hypothetical protein
MERRDSKFKIEVSMLNKEAVYCKSRSATTGVNSGTRAGF